MPFSSQERPICFSKALLPVNIDGAQSGILIENLRPPCVKNFEETLFEAYRDMAERAFGVPITVIAEYDVFFAERIRAILRGAVYGRFSLLIRGILCEKDLKNALFEINRVFCELETDGREFNGYIQRGICIDSPMLLRQNVSTDGIDLCVIDADRLISLMTNNSERTESYVLSLVADEIKAALLRWRKAECFAILGKYSTNEDFCRQLTNCGICSFFVSKGFRDATATAIGVITEDQKTL